MIRIANHIKFNLKTSNSQFYFKNSYLKHIYYNFTSKQSNFKQKTINFSNNNNQKIRQLILNRINSLNLDRYLKQKKNLNKQTNNSQEQSMKFFKNNKILIFFVLGALIFLIFTAQDQNNPTQFTGHMMISQQNMVSYIINSPNPLTLIIFRVNSNKINSLESTKQYHNQCILYEINSHITKRCVIKSLSQFLNLIEKVKSEVQVKFHYKQNKPYQFGSLSQIITFSILGSLLFLFFYTVRRSWKEVSKQSGNVMGQIFDFTNFSTIKADNITTKFNDVAGLHEAKFQITEFVDFLRNPDKYIEMGAKIPKGALLTGPPGTGKTLLAKACAGEASVPFYYVSGSDFVEKYVGLGAARVRKLFVTAEQNAPSIIFIDEIDTIGQKRSQGPFSNEQKDNTLNQLLVKMDGFQTKSKVIVIAATNRKQSLDPALLRPGRFDRSIQISLPSFAERKQILKVHLQKILFSPSLTLDEIANKISIITPGFSGAQLANICNEAAILAARDNKQSITLNQFQKATERVFAGLQKRNRLSKEEKQMLAYYQCGKCVIAWFMAGSDPIIKISILSFSKKSQGYSQTIEDEVALNTYEDLLGKVCYYLAGRSAEKHFRQYITTNGNSDLKRAKRIIRYIVTKFGMSQKLKMIAFPDIQFVRKPYSEQIQAIIDQQIQKIVTQCQQKIELMIAQKASLIEKLKQELELKETLKHSQIQKILGQRQQSKNENYQKFLEQQNKIQLNLLQIENKDKKNDDNDSMINQK